MFSKAIDEDIRNKDLKFTKTKNVISHYKKELDEATANFDQQTNVDKMVFEQPGWLQYYSIMATELKSGTEYIETYIDEYKSELWKDLTERHSRDLSQMDKSNYINSDKTYIAYKRIYIAIKEMQGFYDAVVEGYKAQGYTLNSYLRYLSTRGDNND